MSPSWCRRWSHAPHGSTGSIDCTAPAALHRQHLGGGRRIKHHACRSVTHVSQQPHTCIEEGTQ